MTCDYNTPFYYIDKQSLDNAYNDLEQAISQFWPKSVVGYSFKTNSLPWVVKYMQGRGSYAEVVSDDEYNLAISLGYKRKNIIYNGIAKTKETLLSAIKGGGIVNLDSHEEINWLRELPSQGKYTVGLRVNFDLEKLCPGETSCGEEGGRFGFCVDNSDFKDTLKSIQDLGNIEVVGLHMHCSTKTRSLNVYSALTSKACELARKFDIRLEYIDIGGGFYGGLEGKPSFYQYLETISSVLVENEVPDLTLIIEPGVSIIGPYISYVTSVVDIKETTKNRFVVTDGSRIHIDTRMVKNDYFKDIFYSCDGNRDVIKKQVVCGFTCMEMDRIITLVDNKELKKGDKIVFHKVGAYTLSFAPLFIKYFPDVYVKENDHLRKVRERWTQEEYSQKCIK